MVSLPLPRVTVSPKLSLFVKVPPLKVISAADKEVKFLAQVPTLIVIVSPAEAA